MQFSQTIPVTYKYSSSENTSVQNISKALLETCDMYTEWVRINSQLIPEFSIVFPDGVTAPDVEAFWNLVLLQIVTGNVGVLDVKNNYAEYSRVFEIANLLACLPVRDQLLSQLVEVPWASEELIRRFFEENPVDRQIVRVMTRALTSKLGLLYKVIEIFPEYYNKMEWKRQNSVGKQVIYNLALRDEVTVTTEWCTCDTDRYVAFECDRDARDLFLDSRYSDFTADTVEKIKFFKKDRELKRITRICDSLSGRYVLVL